MKIEIRRDAFDHHLRRSLERAEKLSRGEKLEPEKILTFEDPVMMFEILSAQRVRLFHEVRKRPLSISALAEELGRNRGSVTRDVNKLKAYGLIRLRQKVNPGHGKVMIVEPTAKRIEMHATL